MGAFTRRYRGTLKATRIVGRAPSPRSSRWAGIAPPKTPGEIPVRRLGGRCAAEAPVRPLLHQEPLPVPGSPDPAQHRAGGPVRAGPMMTTLLTFATKEKAV